jgi:hypothetical protein
MSQAQTSLTIAAPGFLGLNTEASQSDLPDGYAQVADNCVIDKRGRIAARKGFHQYTDSIGLLYQQPSTMASFLGEDGSEVIFVGADDRIYTANIGQTGTNAYTLMYNSNNMLPNWQMLTLNDKMFFIQQDQDPLIFSHTGGGAGAITASTPYSMPRAKCGVSAFGRLWLANTDTDNHQVVYYSSRLDGTDFDTNPPEGSGRDAGSFNVSHYWPTGFDTIEALTVHNGSLIIFGKNNIIVYNQAEGNPAAAPSAGGISLGDTVGGIGCIARDSVVSTGLDILFLDRTGVRSLGRVIQEKSMPVGEASANVRTPLRNSLAGYTDTELQSIRGQYVPEEAMYLLISAIRDIVLVFSTSVTDEKGAMRVTRWPSSGASKELTCSTMTQGGKLLLGNLLHAVNVYEGYGDSEADGTFNDAYQMSYYTNYLTFGDPSKTKMVKDITATINTRSANNVSLAMSFDYSQSDTNINVDLPVFGMPAEYSVAEFGIGEMGPASEMVRKKINVGGSGTSVRIGITTSVTKAFSIQELTINTLLGRKL